MNHLFSSFVKIYGTTSLMNLAPLTCSYKCGRFPHSSISLQIVIVSLAPKIFYHIFTRVFLPIRKFEHAVMMLVQCLCTRPCFEPTLFCGPCNHVSCSLPHFMIFHAITCTRATLFFVSPLKAIQAH
jgi:hypothetical protein